MLIYNASPYRNSSLWKRWKNIAFSMLLLILLTTSTMSIFTFNKANADDFKVCKDISVVTEDTVNDSYKNRLKEKLLASGASNISFIPSNEYNQNTNSDCVIFDYKINNEDMDKVFTYADKEGLEKMFISLPAIKSSEKDYLEYASLVESKKPNNDKIEVIDYSKQLDNNYGVLNGGELTNKGINTKINVILKSLVDAQGENYVLDYESNSLNDIVTVRPVQDESESDTETDTSADPETVVDNRPPNANPGVINDDTNRWRNDPYGNTVNSGFESNIADPSSSGDPSDPTRGADNFERSPRAAAARVVSPSMNKMSVASNYLAGKRWSNLRISDAPNSAFILDGFQNSIANAINNNISLNSIGLINSLGVRLTTYAFTSTMLSVMVNTADNILSNLTSGRLMEGDLVGGALGSFISSVMILTIIIAVIKALSPSTGGTFQQRFAEAGTGIGKVAVLLGVLFGISIQSQKNHLDSTAVDDIGNQVNNAMRGEQYSGYRDINQPSTWVVGSLGWLMSTVYWIVNIVVSAASEVIVIITQGPIETISRTNTEANSDYDYNFACERYIDSMHYIFSKTGAYNSAPTAGKFLITMDQLTLSLYKDVYSTGYGANTSSAKNSWCNNAESLANSPANEQALISRGAGLYKEVLGSGNLMAAFVGDNETLFSNGHHYSDANSNLEDGLPLFGGILVNQDGSWRYAQSDISDGNLKQFFGSGGEEPGASGNSSSYYRAACTWDPTGKYGRLSVEWQRVRAMGPTGGVNGESIDEKSFNPYISIITGSEEGEDGAVGALKDRIFVPYEEPVSRIINDHRGYAIRNTELLNDLDCVDPALFAIGNDQNRNTFGMGKNNPRSQRWDYSPLKGTTLAEQLKSTVANVIETVIDGTPLRTLSDASDDSAGLAEQIYDWITPNPSAEPGQTWLSTGEDAPDDERDPESEEYYNPMNKFGANIATSMLETPVTSNTPAASYWLARSGSYNQVITIPLMAVTVAVAMNGVIFGLMILVSVIINWIISLLFILIPFIMIMSLFLLALKGGRDD